MSDKFGDMMGRFGKAPKGMGLGIKLLAGAVGLGYVGTQSVYTGTFVTLIFLGFFLLIFIFF